MTIDVAGHQVTRGGEPISLTPLEFDLLVALARKPWQVFSREILLEEVWGSATRRTRGWSTCTSSGSDRRSRKDPENPEIVVTVRGVGYKAGQSA